MNFGSIPFVARATPIGGGGAPVISDGVKSTDSAWGNTLAVAIPSGMVANDHLVVVTYNFGAAVTSFSTGTWKSITPSSWAGTNQEIWLSTSFGSVPGSLTCTFAADSIHGASAFSISNLDYAASPLSNSNSTTSFSSSPRAHAYTTTAANSVMVGVIDFIGGGVTGGTGQDSAHTWVGLTGANNITFAGLRATAGSYDATVGPTGAGSDSNYWVVELGAA